MLKFKTSILFVLPLLLAIGLFMVVTADEKPIPVVYKTTLSPNAQGSSPDPNYELKDELASNPDASEVPLDEPYVMEETLPGESAYEQYMKKWGNSMTNIEPEKEPYSGPDFVNGTPKTGGEDIATATIIGGVPYTDVDTTCNYVDDYDEACTWSATAPDAVYEYTPSVTEAVDISLCNSGYDTKLYLYENSYTPGAPYACNDDFCPGYMSFLGNLTLTGGNTYYIVVDGYGSGCGGYVLEITPYEEPDPCVFECPAGAFTEAEACGADANGGCNMATPTTEAISAGETVCGTVWADLVEGSGTRDTDWYELTLTAPSVVTLTGMGIFDFILGFVDTSDCALASALDPYSTGGACDTITTSRIAGPGTVWIFASATVYEGYPCGTTNDYWATVEVEEITEGACCDPATGDCIPDLEEAICNAMFGGTGDWHGGMSCDPNPCPPPATPGDNCTEPYVVTLPAELDFSVTSYTCGRGNNYSETGMGYYDGGEDMVFEITVTSDVYVDFLMDPMGTSYSGIGLFDGCPDVGAVVEMATGSSTDPKGFGAYLVAGTYWVMVDTWPSPDCLPTFGLTITAGTEPTGRCCYGDPVGTNCDDFPPSVCAGMGGVWTADTDCATSPCVIASPGDNCGDPFEVKLPGDMTPDFVHTSYTCGRGNSYDATCLGSYDGGEDMIYWLDVDSPINVNILLDPGTTSYTGISIDNACPNGDPCLASSTNYSAGPHGMYGVSLEPGSYYVMMDTYPSPDCIPEFTLTITDAGEGPENDDWDKCEEIGEVSDLPFETVAATFDGPGNCQTAANVWYCYTASCDGPASASLCGSGYDTKMAVYDGVGDPATLTEIGCNDDYSCPAKALQSQVDWYATAGNSYLIEVGGYSANVGTGILNTTCEPDTCTPPPNDNCADVTPATLTWDVTTTFSGDNTCSHNECTLLADNGHAWEAFTVTGAADVVLTYCTTTPSFDLVYIVLADACPCEAGAGLVYATTTDWDACGDGNVTMYYDGLPAGTYYIPVLSDHPDYPSDYYEGPYTINVTASEWVAAYCDASGGCDEYIENVTVGGINNSSACEGYGDFTGLSAYMNYGGVYPITITVGGAYSSDEGGVWVDWNQNLMFEAGEAVTLTGTPGVGPYTGDVIVPGDAVAGPTRMRVRLTYAGTPEPCGTTSYGEAEDYTIVVGGTAPNLTIDPMEFDFGVVDQDASGNGVMTLGSDNETPIGYSIEVAYGVKASVGGGQCDETLRMSPFVREGHIPAQTGGGDKAPFFEGFEGGVPPVGWSVIVNNPYTWDTASYAAYEGLLYASCVYDQDYTGDQDEWLISDVIDLDGNYALNFWWNGSYYWSVDPYDNCDLLVKISIDGGGAWTTLWGEDDYGVFTNWEWNNTILPLTAYSGESNVKIAFVYEGYDGAQLSVDAVSLEAAPMSWLTPGPASGTVPGNGTTDVGVFYDMVGLDFGVYTAEMTITHTGAKGTDVIPVTIEVGETGTNILTVDPDPIYAMMEFPYEEMSAMFYLGGEFDGGGHVVEEIETCPVNGITPLSLAILESMEGFAGHVMQIEIDIVDFVSGYPLLWDVTMQEVTIDIGYFGGGTGVQTVMVEMIGHTSGDANYDGNVNVLDVTHVISYVYKNGAEPEPIIHTADSNGDGNINILDCTYMIKYLYKNGPAPTHP